MHSATSLPDVVLSHIPTPSGMISSNTEETRLPIAQNQNTNNQNSSSEAHYQGEQTQSEALLPISAQINSNEEEEENENDIEEEQNETDNEEESVQSNSMSLVSADFFLAAAETNNRLVNRSLARILEVKRVIVSQIGWLKNESSSSFSYSANYLQSLNNSFPLRWNEHSPLPADTDKKTVVPSSSLQVLSTSEVKDDEETKKLKKIASTLRLIADDFQTNHTKVIVIFV